MNIKSIKILKDRYKAVRASMTLFSLTLKYSPQHEEQAKALLVNLVHTIRTGMDRQEERSVH